MSDAVRLLLTAEEAAERLSLSRTTIYELIRYGDLESVRIGRARRIPAEALGRFVERLTANRHGDHPSAPTSAAAPHRSPNTGRGDESDTTTNGLAPSVSPLGGEERQARHGRFDGGGHVA